MPIINGLQTSLIRDVNASLATTLFPRFMRTFFGKLTGSVVSTALVEPFAFDGASPLLRRFNGNMNGRRVPSFSLQVPNPIYKNFEEIGRTSFEMDQTGTVRKRAAAIGIRVAQGPDYLMARKILKGSTETSHVFEGSTYNTGFDGKAQFSLTHDLRSGISQSNLLTGGLPTTLAALYAMDVAEVVQILHGDMQRIISAIASYVDDKGAQIFPDFDPQEHLQIIGPPGLRPAFDLAFKTPGSIIGGSASGSNGSTTNILPKMVKEVLTPGLLAGCIDIDDPDEARITPVNETDYYWAITDDYVRPWYFQRFRPKRGSEIVPSGYDPEAEAEKALNAARSLGMDSPRATAEAADLYAMTTIDTNLGAIGDKAQESTVSKEAFFISGRTRFTVFNGPWFLCGKVAPAGTSA